MFSPRRISVGTEPVDLTADTGVSGVTIQYLRNKGDTTLFLGDVEGGIPIEPGETFPPMSLGSTDRVSVVREEGEGPVDIALGWA